MGFLFVQECVHMYLKTYIIMLLYKRKEDIIMSFTNVSSLRKNLFNTIDTVVEFNEPVVVNTKKGNAVIISEEDYNAMLETIFLISQKGLVKTIKEGEKEEIESMPVYNPNEEW